MALSYGRRRPTVPRPIEGTMVPIHLMRRHLGAKKFDKFLAEHGGYVHDWGTGNRAYRRMLAAEARHV